MVLCYGLLRRAPWNEVHSSRNSPGRRCLATVLKRSWRKRHLPGFGMSGRHAGIEWRRSGSSEALIGLVGKENEPSVTFRLLKEASIVRVKGPRCRRSRHPKSLRPSVSRSIWRLRIRIPWPKGHGGPRRAVKYSRHAYNCPSGQCALPFPPSLAIYRVATATT
jgi:hypothetical protein